MDIGVSKYVSEIVVPLIIRNEANKNKKKGVETHLPLISIKLLFDPMLKDQNYKKNFQAATE